ncbi:MAG: hypothetical protein AAFV69_04245 [Pseudomonadota bacterium]
MTPVVDVVIPPEIDALTEHRPLFGRARPYGPVKPKLRWRSNPKAWAFRRAFRGELGLAWTFWMWGVVYSIPFGLLNLASIYLAVKFASDDTISTALLIAGQAVSIGWGLFISAAIFNAAKYDRNRGFWGWTATVLVVIGVAMMPVNLYKSWNPTFDTWNKVEGIATALSLTAPVTINEVLTLTKVSADETNKSMTWHMDADVETIDEMTFDPVAVKNQELSGCDDLKGYLDGPVETLYFAYTATDGTVGQIAITEADCEVGYQPVPEPTEVAQTEKV